MYANKHSSNVISYFQVPLSVYNEVMERALKAESKMVSLMDFLRNLYMYIQLST
jgi:hypothetical protein